MDYPTDPSERVYDWVEENAKNDWLLPLPKNSEQGSQ
jgi:hypothetical protein